MADQSETLAERDGIDNNLLAAGGVFAALYAAGLDPEILTDDGNATNAMAVSLDYMKSRYRITVERIPEDEERDHG